MNIYLDICCVFRPLDVKNQQRISIEAEAVLGIIALCQTGHIELISSQVLEYEINNNTLMIRREHGRQVLSKATTIVPVTKTVEDTARMLIEHKFHPLDALHLTSAIAAKANYLCTCDDYF